MKHQALRPVALMLSVLLAAAAPVHAGTIGFADAVRAAAEGRRYPTASLHLHAIQQGGKATAAGVQGAPGGGSGSASSNDPSKSPDTSAGGTGAPISVIAQDPGQQQGGTVETIDLGDVTGTVCDCGVIPVTPDGGRGFPWLPFLGIPLICLTGICTGDDTPPDTPPGPNPTPTPPPIPEPATLLLFGSGLLALGAGARRRRAHKSLDVKTSDAEVL